MRINTVWSLLVSYLKAICKQCATPPLAASISIESTKLVVATLGLKIVWGMTLTVIIQCWFLCSPYHVLTSNSKLYGDRQFHTLSDHHSIWKHSIPDTQHFWIELVLSTYDYRNVLFVQNGVDIENMLACFCQHWNSFLNSIIIYF